MYPYKDVCIFVWCVHSSCRFGRNLLTNYLTEAKQDLIWTLWFNFYPLLWRLPPTLVISNCFYFPEIIMFLTLSLQRYFSLFLESFFPLCSWLPSSHSSRLSLKITSSKTLPWSSMLNPIKISQNYLHTIYNCEFLTTCSLALSPLCGYFYLYNLFL